MDPTAEEVAAFANVANVMTWAGVRGDPADAASEAASLLHHLELAAAEHPRYVAVLPADTWAQFVQNWSPNGVPANAQQLGAALLVHRGCLAIFAAPPPSRETPPAPTTAPPPAEQRMVKLNLTVDPSREESKPALQRSELE
eukprot:3245118-Amphidinium_carterae.1